MRICPTPMLTEDTFIGTPEYAELPVYEELRREINEFAYRLWERWGWESDKCWLIAEKVLFCGLEKIGISDVGYRVSMFLGEDENGQRLFETKVITYKYPVRFVLMKGQKVSARKMAYPQ